MRFDDLATCFNNERPAFSFFKNLKKLLGMSVKAGMGNRGME